MLAYVATWLHTLLMQNVNAATYSIVLRPNMDAENPAHRSGLTRVSQRTHATREGAEAVAEGISAGGRMWASVVATAEALRMVRTTEAVLS